MEGIFPKANVLNPHHLFRTCIRIFATILGGIFLVLSMSSLAYAQEEAGETAFSSAKLGKDGLGIHVINTNSANEVPGKIIPFLTGTVVLISILVFMIGGGFWIFSAGNDSLVERGKTMMLYSVLGIVLVLGAYVITVLYQTILYSLGT